MQHERKNLRPICARGYSPMFTFVNPAPPQTLQRIWRIPAIPNTQWIHTLWPYWAPNHVLRNPVPGCLTCLTSVSIFIMQLFQMGWCSKDEWNKEWLGVLLQRSMGTQTGDNYVLFRCSKSKAHRLPGQSALNQQVVKNARLLCPWNYIGLKNLVKSSWSFVLCAKKYPQQNNLKFTQQSLNTFAYLHPNSCLRFFYSTNPSFCYPNEELFVVFQDAFERQVVKILSSGTCGDFTMNACSRRSINPHGSVTRLLIGGQVFFTGGVIVSRSFWLVSCTCVLS